MGNLRGEAGGAGLTPERRLFPRSSAPARAPRPAERPGNACLKKGRPGSWAELLRRCLQTEQPVTRGRGSSVAPIVQHPDVARDLGGSEVEVAGLDRVGCGCSGRRAEIGIVEMDDRT